MRAIPLWQAEKVPRLALIERTEGLCTEIPVKLPVPPLKVLDRVPPKPEEITEPVQLSPSYAARLTTDTES
jgi:hypothetical protein